MRGRIRKLVLIGALAASLAVVASPAVADHPHRPEESGHPIRIAAYLLHPVGVLIDTLFFRPAHWLVNREPWKTIVGHKTVVGHTAD